MAMKPVPMAFASRIAKMTDNVIAENLASQAFVRKNVSALETVKMDLIALEVSAVMVVSLITTVLPMMLVSMDNVPILAKELLIADPTPFAKPPDIDPYVYAKPVTKGPVLASVA